MMITGIMTTHKCLNPANFQIYKQRRDVILHKTVPALCSTHTGKSRDRTGYLSPKFLETCHQLPLLNHQ